MSGKIFTIAPHAPFLQTLATRILDGTLLANWDVHGPFGLSDVTIILPTNRARLALADAFATQLGGSALLPQIRTFGGAPEEEELFLPPYDTEPLPPTITPLTRKLVLAKLVEAWVKLRGDAAADNPAFSGFANPPSMAEIIALAESLGELIDDFHIQQADIKNLSTVDTGDNSAHWQTNLDFLKIALETWPEYLAEQGQIDAAARRNLQLARQAATLEHMFGDKPVIAAGSTGSIPATADLLKAISALPRGLIVLPGLDTSLSVANRQSLENPAKNPHGHPQYGLVQLLARLNARFEDVTELGPTAHPRTKIIRHALALADETGDWAEARDKLQQDLPKALDNLAIAVTRTDEEQARVIALAARQALADGKTIGIISPDRNLARRIAAEIKRFDVALDDSAGTPLFQSRGGRLVRQILTLATTPFAPVELVSLLHNRSITLGRERADIVQRTDLMERAILRGQRAAPGRQGLAQLLEKNCAGEMPYAAYRLSDTEKNNIQELLSDVEAALAPLTKLFETPHFALSAFARAVLATLDALTTPSQSNPVPSADVLTEIKDWLTTLSTETGGPDLTINGIAQTLQALMAGYTTRPQRATRSDIAIWGLLEARLQNPDVMVLAGMSETIWPQTADPGPWLNRQMRLALGLEPPERRQGQAAHDFEMAMGNGEILITRSDRVGTSPAAPSRLLQRLEGFIGEANTKTLHARGEVWVTRARDLDYVGPPKPAQRPAPSPPAHLRPKRLSVTEIEKLIRSPYDIYAKHVLKLRPLAPLGEDPDLSERGTLVHQILGDFITEGYDPAAPNAAQKLSRIADDAFQSLTALPERRILWRNRFDEIAEAFLEYEKSRSAALSQRHSELDGAFVLNRPDGAFTLKGRADRVDMRKDGGLEILDFKTGAPPDPKDMNSFTAPQLLLEALIAREGGFKDVPAADPMLLAYVKLNFGPNPLDPKSYEEIGGQTLDAAVTTIGQRLSQLVDAYLFTSSAAMSAEVFPDPKKRYAGDYDHLARLGEWASISGEGEGE